MGAKTTIAALFVTATCVTSRAADDAQWRLPAWRCRTIVERPSPYRDGRARPVEAVIDFDTLLEHARIAGQLDPASIRVVDRRGRERPCAYRAEIDVATGKPRQYVTWIDLAQPGEVGAVQIYFDTRDRGIQSAGYGAGLLPQENVLADGGFEDESGGWSAEPRSLLHYGRFAHTTGTRSLKVVVDEQTSDDTPRTVVLSQKLDVSAFAGQEMVFACDLFAERASYGAPVNVEVQQFQADGSRILECAVDPRWLTLELAQGQLVRFHQRGRFSPEAATAEVQLRLRCYVQDADTRQIVTGPDSWFTVWLDRVVLRAGERRPWPSATNAGFVEGALDSAPLNRGFHFTGRRRLAFNGASEGALTAGVLDPGPATVHWGPAAGTLEFWCCPDWDYDDGVERMFFKGYAYMYRLQSLLRKCGSPEGNQLEFAVADGNRELHRVRGTARLQKGKWSHIAATWDYSAAHLQLFVDGRRIAEQGPGRGPWPFSLRASDDSKPFEGIGVAEKDKRSLPMQAFIGGEMHSKSWPEDQAAEAVLDELRISSAVRYSTNFTPPRSEFAIDEHTCALWHFENERHGVHGGDDRFVRSYLGVEEPLQQETATLDVWQDGRVDRRDVLVAPHATAELFEANRGENRLGDEHPFREMPDARFIEYRWRTAQRVADGTDDAFDLRVGGDLPPLMQEVTFERAQDSPDTTLLPRWRANDNVVPFSARSLGATLAPNAGSDAEKAVEVMRYANATGAYYDAHYCETLPCGRHRPRVSYTFLKALNIYPYDQCGPSNFTLRKLFLAVGISSNDSAGTHHQFQQAFYDGDFRLFDLASRMYWLNRDNTTVASLRQLGEDPYVKLRQPGSLNSFYPGRPSRARWGVAERPHNMDFPLRPGERAVIGWVNQGRWFELTGQREPISMARIPPFYGNGAIVYEPAAQGEAARLENVVVDGNVVRVVNPSGPASLTYQVQCPYILTDAHVSGTYSGEEAGTLAVSLSVDQGKTWTPVWRNAAEAGDMAVNLLPHVAARYAYWLKVEWPNGGKASIRSLKVRTTFLNSALSLPGALSLGDNRITFVEAKPTVPIRTTCSWIERHRTDLGVSLGALAFYNLDYARHRNVFIAPPGRTIPLRVTVQGRAFKGEVGVQGLPAGWACDPPQRGIDVQGPDSPASVEMTLRAPKDAAGRIAAFDVVLRDGESVRRVPAEVLAADAALVRKAESADVLDGAAEIDDLLDASGRRVVRFAGKGELAYTFQTSQAGTRALWLRARWEPGSPATFRVQLDDKDPREVRAHRMIGFSDWTDSRRAYTKGFLHFPKQYEHWAWYRAAGVDVAAGKHRLLLQAGPGTSIDTLVMLDQTPAMDRAAMNLFQNWNYSAAASE